jgi:hypothetical protein
VQYGCLARRNSGNTYEARDLDRGVLALDAEAAWPSSRTVLLFVAPAC